MRTGEVGLREPLPPSRGGRTQLHGILLSPRNGLPIPRQAMLTELNQRIREGRQGPDGLLYLLTDEEAGALLRLEPVETAQ